MPNPQPRLKSPGVGRPARGFTPERAQQWVLTAAVLTAVIYAFRRIVEPTTSTGQAKGNTAQRLVGAGSPPPSLPHWAIAYATAFIGLSMLTLAAPELAASMAMLAVVGNLLANGTTIAADITGLAPETAQPATKLTPATPQQLHAAKPGVTAAATGAAAAANFIGSL